MIALFSCFWSDCIGYLGVACGGRARSCLGLVAADPKVEADLTVVVLVWSPPIADFSQVTLYVLGGSDLEKLDDTRVGEQMVTVPGAPSWPLPCCWRRLCLGRVGVYPTLGCSVKKVKKKKSLKSISCNDSGVGNWG